jgi:hypothetical protein
LNKKNLLYFGIGTLIGVSVFVLVMRKILVKYRVVRLAKKEWIGWGKSTIDINGKQTKAGGFEANDGYSQRVAKYWKEGTNLNYDGTNREQPWSATFISWIMKKGGAGNKFEYNASHSNYILDSVENRKNGKLNAPFVAYKINEVAPKLGDMVCYSRQVNVNYDTKGSYKSHCDIVVSKSNSKIEVIGGNVNQSVTKKILPIDSNGLLTDKRNNWFVVIKTNI